VRKKEKKAIVSGLKKEDEVDLRTKESTNQTRTGWGKTRDEYGAKESSQTDSQCVENLEARGKKGRGSIS